MNRKRRAKFWPVRRPKNPGPARLVVGTGNWDYTRGGDRQYLAWVQDQFPELDLLFRQEVVRGLEGVQFRRFGKVRVWARRLVPLGRVGAHRAVRFGRTKLGRETLGVFSAHGLHKGTTSPEAHLRHMKRLGKRLRRWTRRGRHWLGGMDANWGLQKVAEELGGTAVGEGTDLLIVSPGLRIRLLGIDYTPVTRGWSDHPFVWAEVTLR